MRFLSAACCSSVASAAIALGGFAAVGARALAIVNEFAASVAMRQFASFFYHSVRLCHILLSRAIELTFRKSTNTASRKVQGKYKGGSSLTRALAEPLMLQIQKNSCVEKEGKWLFQKIVKCPVVLFFLHYYVFKHSSCLRVTALQRFSNDLPIQHYGVAFSLMI